MFPVQPFSSSRKEFGSRLLSLSKNMHKWSSKNSFHCLHLVKQRTSTYVKQLTGTWPFCMERKFMTWDVNFHCTWRLQFACIPLKPNVYVCVWLSVTKLNRERSFHFLLLCFTRANAACKSAQQIARHAATSWCPPPSFIGKQRITKRRRQPGPETRKAVRTIKSRRERQSQEL